MSFLSNRVEKLAESETLAMARLGNELKEKGVNVINMSLGEPDFATPDFIKIAAKEAIDKNFSYYTPVPGYKDLQEAISAKFKRDNNLNYKPSQIVVSTGAKQSIINVVMATVNPGDEVILPAPYWVSYSEMIQLNEGKVVEIQTDYKADFKITPEQLEKAITPKTKMFLFSNPCNPTGTMYTEKELRALGEVFKKNPHVLIVSDEIYEYISFTEKMFSIGSIPELANRTVTVNGVSKGFAMTGWRLGYLGAPEEVAKACVKIQGQFTSGPSSISQRAAMAAVSADPDVVHTMQVAFKNRRDLLISLMKEVPNIKLNNPGGAFYLFPEVSSYFGKKNGDTVIKDAKDLCMYLLNVGHVAMTPGGAFGAPNYLRLSYATSEEKIREAVKRIATALAQLK
ncbi:pyridoxal phosphate-dependent aminotransferase [Peredibacter sp. HCB2-198]|uniref:pyridoxal phosphate-dependent aminotransferase n=1 Tax=Peredibacter sp. HCB2-198 TaxID=3383025 RepID=UPI0038B62CF6